MCGVHLYNAQARAILRPLRSLSGQGRPIAQAAGNSSDRTSLPSHRASAQASTSRRGVQPPLRRERDPARIFKAAREKDGGTKLAISDPEAVKRTSTNRSASPRTIHSRLPRSAYPTPTPIDLSALPPLTPHRLKIHFKGFDLSSTISAFHKPSTPSTPLCVYKDPLIHLRAIPTIALPPAPLPPFPPSAIDSNSLRARKPGSRIIQFGIVTSKSNVSNLAVKRVRTRNRFRAAMLAVVERSAGLPPGHRGSDYLNTDWSYLVMLNASVYGARMKDLCGSVAGGLRWIRKLQDKGIGSERQRTGKVYPLGNSTTKGSDQPGRQT